MIRREEDDGLYSSRQANPARIGRDGSLREEGEWVLIPNGALTVRLGIVMLPLPLDWLMSRHWLIGTTRSIFGAMRLVVALSLHGAVAVLGGGARG